MLNFPFSLGLIHRLTSEIDQLSGQQIEACAWHVRQMMRHRSSNTAKEDRGIDAGA